MNKPRGWMTVWRMFVGAVVAFVIVRSSDGGRSAVTDSAERARFVRRKSLRPILRVILKIARKGKGNAGTRTRGRCVHGRGGGARARTARTRAPGGD
jgi:hypothetical protein